MPGITKVNNFSCLTKNNFYKVKDVLFFNPDHTIYTLESGQRVCGRFGINEIFGVYSVPFYFQYKGRADSELFKRYTFVTFEDSEDLVAQKHDEILEILINYIGDKVCEGCMRHRPDEPPMDHSCLLETRIKQAKQYLTVALDEHPKYDVGDIVDAFVDFRTQILGRTF